MLHEAITYKIFRFALLLGNQRERKIKMQEKVKERYFSGMTSAYFCMTEPV